MGRPTKTSQIFASSYSFEEPQGLDRAPVTNGQTRFDEDTIIWGDDDALPLRILQAVTQSPTATSCLGKVSDYMQGSGFTDPELVKIPIDKDGTTLGQLHNNLCDYMAKLEGFSVRFTYDMEGRITNCYVMPVESCRFVKPNTKRSRKISEIKYNPYWGTSQWDANLTSCYNVFEPNQSKRYAEISSADPRKYLGQIYFEGTPRAPYKFYQVPKYWSGANAIYTDAAIDSFVKKGLDNGFFQSLLINMIGDPNQKSQNPKYQKKVTGTDGTIRLESDGTTIGQEFQEMMSTSFSGHDKAFKAMVLWAMNESATAKIQPFPSNQSFALVDTLEIRTIRKIAIACEVQAILANLPQQTSSLGSDGDSMRVAVELMQARVKEPQQILENFYNNILLPNLQYKTASKVKIKNHAPISNQVQVPDKVWEWMNDQEKADFVRINIPSVTVNRVITPPQPTQDPNAPQTAQQDVKATGALKDLKMSEVNRVTNIVSKVAKGKLTRAQGVQFLKDYGFTDEQIIDWLPEEEAIV